MQGEQQLGPNDYGSTSGGEKSPLSQFGFFKNLGAEKKQTKDGNVPKRRGPKPDSKPALTRRQELNRQAQRTHRERKEMYIKALEQEVLRLKEAFAESSREREKVQQENERLKALLAQHGISYDFGQSPVQFRRTDSSFGPASTNSISGSYTPATTSVERSPGVSDGFNSQYVGPSVQAASHTATIGSMLPNNNIDYDEVGVDFVLTLERPCMDHMQYLVVRSHNSDAQDFHHPSENADDREYEHMSGHALMATCPTHKHIMETPNAPYPYCMPDLEMPDLRKLLDLSSRLPLNHDSEITPIMAWTQIYRNPRIRELTAADLERIKLDLGSKTRCYGFGAVLEEFEVVDALGAVFSERDSVSAMATGTGEYLVTP